MKFEGIDRKVTRSCSDRRPHAYHRHGISDMGANTVHLERICRLCAAEHKSSGVNTACTRMMHTRLPSCAYHPQRHVLRAPDQLTSAKPMMG